MLLKNRSRFLGFENASNLKAFRLKGREELVPSLEAVGLYQVLSGALQTTHISEDGRRWISDFSLPGEFILVECDEARSQFFQALCATSLLRVANYKPGASPLHSETCDGDFIAKYLLEAHHAAVRAGFLLSRSSAIERLAYFLVDLMRRYEERRHLRLLMSRAEIGDHLGLTSETVTRTFTHFQRVGYVQVKVRELDILNPTGLAQLATAVSTI